MTTLTLLVAGYPALLAALVAADRATGYVLADAMGKPRPRRCPLCGAPLPSYHGPNDDCPTCGER